MNAISILKNVLVDVGGTTYVTSVDCSGRLVSFTFDSGETIDMTYNKDLGKAAFIYKGETRYIRVYLTPNTYVLGRYLFILDGNGVVEIYAVES